MKNSNYLPINNSREPLAVTSSSSLSVKIPLVALCGTIALFCGSPAGAAESAPAQILARPKAHLSQQAVRTLFAAHGVKPIEVISQIRVHVLEVPGSHLEQALDALRQNPNIEFAELNAKTNASAVANDPFFPSQWHLGKVQAPQGWDITKGSEGIVVGIVDTGIDLVHPDFAGRILPGIDYVNSDSDPSDDNGHGTAVAGVAAATGNNGVGIAGVAWVNQILPIKVLDAAGTGMSDKLCKGIIYAADNGARIINASVGSYGAASSLQAAVDYAWGKNTLLVAAAGNDAVSTPLYPAACVRAIGVSATTSSDALASFSNYGSYLSLSAPGQSIWTINGSTYGGWSGTSFASPIVAGAAALVGSRNPQLSNMQIADLLTKNSDDLGAPGFDNYYGYGRVNVYRALNAAVGVSADVTAPSVSITSPSSGSTVSGVSTVQIAAVDNIGISKVELYVNSAFIAVAPTAPASIDWDTRAYVNGSASLLARAYDAAGNTADSGAIPVTVQNVADTTAPFTQITVPLNNATVSANTKVYTSSSDNTAVVLVELYVDQKILAQSTSSSAVFTWNTKRAAKGQHTLQTIAYDAAGNAGSSLVVTVVK